jgi:hypothetical protein
MFNRLSPTAYSPKPSVTPTQRSGNLDSYKASQAISKLLKELNASDHLCKKELLELMQRHSAVFEQMLKARGIHLADPPTQVSSLNQNLILRVHGLPQLNTPNESGPLYALMAKIITQANTLYSLPVSPRTSNLSNNWALNMPNSAPQSIF